MQCSEFEAVVHDLNRAGVLDLATREAAIEHAQTCAQCAALREAADSLTAQLYTLAMAEQQHGAPPRVEAALREALCANDRRAWGMWLAPAWAWSLAAVALLTLGLAGWVFRSPREREPVPLAVENTNPALPVHQAAPQPEKSLEEKITPAEKAGGQAQQADYFLPLPYSEPLAPGEDAAVVRVRMARGALGALGLPVNEERANEVIQVEFLVAEDGSPQAIRIPR